MLRTPLFYDRGNEIIYLSHLNLVKYSINLSGTYVGQLGSRKGNIEIRTPSFDT